MANDDTPDNVPQTPAPAPPAEPSPDVPNSTTAPSSVQIPPATDTTPAMSSVDERAQLVSRARSFLRSPSTQQQDIFSKRKFLLDKGLNEVEIEGLLRELPPQLPVVPPRAYPQPPPSNLPNLLLGIFRIFSWLLGGSAALVLIYYRFLLPRITRTTTARHSLRDHHSTLFRNLTASLASLKESQAENLTLLPKPYKFREPSGFSDCRSLKDILRECEEKKFEPFEIPPLTLLRCGIQEFGVGKEEAEANPTTEDLFRLMESHIPWLLSDEGVQYEHKLWETLTTLTVFRSLPEDTHPSDNVRWTFDPPTPPVPSPLLNSLNELSAALPRDSKTKTTALQHTLQSLSDLTGYISAQVYVPFRPYSASGQSNNNNTSPTPADELKREIRALKGLVLNRRSFMPMIPRAGSSSTLSQSVS
ncbi:uncharacterized protein BT62DRAFT_964598 [Guyanagaster necrorhizus]|uniref:Peroxisome membrane anchor protein Pex14p N-terminal domain-containing protein n=1 Tax=Guyanagaster necrorhizus TaxID=856835 RepID=A0A9P8AVD4_9AGAR|nr:uncharacterized protein BT62DRAFT_964598 [Guyanagaster necrorhizus MCA 3950]KAG7449418.1 hypothetical protein BT62DRAFT_964598 [Guyanagaster necrorhizus MCA 3950]